jgi:Bacterial Ig-like domain (group 3)/MBG domain (YGX type)/FG-GAP-like repeat
MSDSLKHLRLLISAQIDGSFAHAYRRSRTRLAFSALVFCFLLSSRVAGAQSATVTTLTATSAGPVSGSIVTMTANVSSAGQPVTGGTVTFRDTFAGAAQNLGTVQVQSANGTPGLAILKTEVGGVGPHSIVAIYNAPNTYSTSISTPAALTFQSPYSSATALAATQSGGTFTLTGTLSAFGPMQPTGSLTFTDTTTNTTIGTVALDSTTATQGFTPPTLYQIPTSDPWGTNSMGTPVSGDFNGDGHPDFAVPTSLGPVTIMLGHGDGTFQQGVSISAAQPFGLVAGDFNGDGNLDLAVGNNGTNGSIAIYLGNGDGTFTAGAVYPAVSGAYYQIVASGDFNRDGIPDLVVSDHANNQVAVLLGNGDGTFQPAGLFATGPEPWNLVVGDINGDGNPDLVVANDISDAQGNNITLLLGNGDGTFRQGTYLKGGVTSSGSVALADFNGDGFLDIAATEEPANDVFIFLGNGDGTFRPATTYSMIKGPYYITIGDFNQDGKKDIITANAEGASIGVLLGNGDGTFQAATTFPTTSEEAIYVDLQDFNGDNQVDVVAVTHLGLQVYLAGNAQTAQFSPFRVTSCDTQSIVATYNGDTNYATSASPVASVSLNGLATTISVAQTPQNAVYGQAVTLTATLTPYVNGSNSSDGTSVSFFDGTTNLGSSNLSNGVASLTITSLTTGSHSFSAVFGGDCAAALTGSTSLAILSTIGKATPAITWANPASIAYGVSLSAAQLNATASVSGTPTYTPAAGTVLPAGNDTLSVTFAPTDTVNYGPATSTVPITVTQGALTITAQDAKRAYGAPNPAFTGAITGALNGDTFTESYTTSATSTSAPGTYSIVPSATGTNLADYAQSVSNGVLTITQASTNLSIVPSPIAASPSQSVTLSATATPATSGTPTGTVSFFNNGSPLGTASLVNGTATYSTTLPLGNNSITASYGGDTNFTSATASAVTVTVAANVLNITAANATRVYGAANPTFTGNITGAQNGDVFIESFTTTATPTSAPGTYAVVPSASGTTLAQYQQVVTNGTLTIAKASVTSTIALSATNVTQGQNVTVTATVASVTSGTPTGTVSFFNNGNALGTATLTNGTATYSTTTLPVGNNVITFTYGGDTNFTANTAGSTTGANSIVVTATPLDFSFQMTSPASGLVGNYGQSVQVTLHVAPTAGQYPGPVQFAVSGTPTVPAAYTFSPATVAAGAGATDVTMTIQIQALTSQNHAPVNSGRLASIALGLLLLPWVSMPRMRKSGHQLGKSLGLSALFLILVGAALSITGCGSSSPSTNTSTPPVGDSIVVNATSGNVQHSVTVNLEVQKAQ